ncbi:hypothetical protein P154DRAFT_46282 [Amniculicola lignicola CBS 123094]|uniref:TM7S3/TM198-like domain-containing protein n=1 Tax=Amniculicola lignicola CBS 123094 TaxID=1392246 RepID=A0A6A5WRR3_9PLEO|nr:hypothetical protein P154DRAFT_46282 [Amniculicola lignicola CBS 123094]
MMRSLRYVFIVLALLFCLDIVTAARHPIARRQQEPQPSEGSAAPATTRSSSVRGSSSAEPSVQPSESKKQSATPSATPSDNAPSSTPPVTAITFIQEPAETASDGPTPSSSSVADTEAPLPIRPTVTPAMGLAGVIMLISGAAYAVIGIKNKWLHVFTSAAYLASLAVTVLIIYLMSPPVRNAIQGAFFVAAVFTGAVFGGLALIFSDITEGLGCLLGGFCLSMWFLTLKEGGLIASAGGRAILIGSMSAAAFLLSFSHRTRTYGLMASMAWSGATITVLGIDCLSRAGLKEFWLYLWNLNPSIFPLNTNTYPMTRGIRVELACVPFFCMLGIISQLRLWKLVKERREKRAAADLEREQTLAQEEEALGRRIEDNFARERAQWEATYGDKSASQHDSAVDSFATVTPKTSTSEREKGDAYGSVEMVALSPKLLKSEKPKTGMTRSLSNNISTGATVTVSVLRDDNIQEIDASGNPISSGKQLPSPPSQSTESSVRPSIDIPTQNVSRTVSMRGSLRASVPPPPVIIPLPFNVPKEDDAQSQDGDNASVSAVPESVRESVQDGRRFSTRFSKRFSVNRGSRNYHNSEEALVPHIDDDRASSIAATMDDANDDMSLPDLTPPQSPTIKHVGPAADFPTPANQVEPNSEPKEAVIEDQISSETPEAPEQEIQKAKTGATVQSSNAVKSHSRGSLIPEGQSLTMSTDPSGVQSKRSSTRPSDMVDSSVVEEGEKSQQTKSVRSGPASLSSRMGSQPAGLAGSLPGKLSKVAMSYRTNEWAKHLEMAEKPDVDDLAEPESPGVKLQHEAMELPPSVPEGVMQPAPVTKPKAKRASTGSNHGNSGQLRAASNPGRYSQMGMASTTTLSRNPSNAVPITAFPPAGHSRPASVRILRSASTPMLQQPLTSPTTEIPSGKTSPGLGNTLMGKRETLVRNRVSTQSFAPYASSPNLPQGSSPNMPYASSPNLAYASSPHLVGGGIDDNVPLSQRKQMMQHQKPPQASQPWRQSGLGVGTALPGFDSHQPKRRSGSNNGRREDLLAGWRESLQQPAAPVQRIVMDETAIRVGLLNERHQKEMEKQQRAIVLEQRDAVVGSRMRSGEMIDAHREAMRKMQAKANKNASQ